MFHSPFVVTVLLGALAVAEPILIDQGAVTLELSQGAKALRSNTAKDKSNLFGAAVINEPVTSQAITYVANVGIGNPATTYQLIIDTGSSNTWVGSHKKYVKTSTSTQTLNKVSVTYGSRAFSGTEYIDQVSIAPKLVIPKQSIGVASSASGFGNVDGILGVGPVALTVHTLSPDFRAKIPTVTDNLFTIGVITRNLISVFYQPSTSELATNGQLTWGGIDYSKVIDQSIKYGDSTILSSTSGIVDTGTTLILIATDAYQQYVSDTGAVVDSDVGLLRITPAQYANLNSLNFVIGGKTYELTPNAQIWPRSLNYFLGGSPDAIYLIVADIGSYSGSGLDFINGLSFLERYYPVYDTSTGCVGFAATRYTKATSN